MEKKIIAVEGLSNERFIEQYAAPGRVGLVGGNAFIDRTIRRLQRRLNAREHSLWSHAFLCSGARMDGRHWVLESDLEFHHKQIRLGVQENRADKYASAEQYPHLAMLDFGLSPAQLQTVMTEALDLLAGLSHYSVRELIGTLLAMRRPTWRARENLLAREGALYCSAMVQHCYAKAGIAFVDGVVVKNTTPQDIANASVPHTMYLLTR